MLTALLPFIFALLWASSYIAAKVGLMDASPFALVGARLSIAAVAAAVLMRILGRSWPRARSWPTLLLGGALLHGFGLAMTHAALVAVDATPTALVHAFHPILTAALSVALFRERFAPWQWLGVSVGPGLFIASGFFALIHVLNTTDYFRGHFEFAWWFGVLAFGSGIFLGVLREKTNSVLAPTIAHGLGNTFAQLAA